MSAHDKGLPGERKTYILLNFCPIRNDIALDFIVQIFIFVAGEQETASSCRGQLLQKSGLSHLLQPTQGVLMSQDVNGETGSRRRWDRRMRMGIFRMSGRRGVGGSRLECGHLVIHMCGRV